jgi:LSD1 subclass zinc finger protein
MAVTLMCPNLRCRKILAVPDKMRGTRVRCSYCGTFMLVPAAGSSRQHLKKIEPAAKEKDADSND